MPFNKPRVLDYAAARDKRHAASPGWSLALRRLVKQAVACFYLQSPEDLQRDTSSHHPRAVIVLLYVCGRTHAERSVSPALRPPTEAPKWLQLPALRTMKRNRNAHFNRRHPTWTLCRVLATRRNYIVRSGSRKIGERCKVWPLSVVVLPLLLTTVSLVPRLRSMHPLCAFGNYGEWPFEICSCALLARSQYDVRPAQYARPSH